MSLICVPPSANKTDPFAIGSRAVGSLRVIRSNTLAPRIRSQRPMIPGPPNHTSPSLATAMVEGYEFEGILYSFKPELIEKLAILFDLVSAIQTVPRVSVAMAPG